MATHFHAGQDAMREGRLAQAKEEFKKVLGLEPGLVEARVNLGLVYHALGDYTLAAENLSTALQQRPGMAGPTMVLGVDYLKLGQVDRAIPTLQQAVHLDASNREAHRALAMCYVSKEEFREAANEDLALARLDPDRADAWFQLGHDYINLAAHMAFRGAEVYRGSAWGNRFLGDMLFQRNRWEDAGEEYLNALNLEPKQPGLHTSFGQAHLHAGKLDKAEGEFQAELALDPKSEAAWLGLAETQLIRGQAAGALEDVGKVWEISPEYLAVQRTFPTVDLPQEAARKLVADLQTAPDTPVKDFLEANLDAASGDVAAEDRWKAFEAEVQAWQKSAQGASGGSGGQNPCLAHRYTTCAQWLEARQPASHADWLLLGKTQFILQQYGNAADTLARLLATDKANVEASYWLARTYQALGGEWYDRLEEEFPDSWRAHQLRAESDNAREATNDAIKEYQLALAARPDEAELHEALGETYLSKKTYDQAEAELQESLKLDPTRPHALFLLGRLYMARHETEKAVPYLQQALRLQPDMAQASNVLGTAYVRLGEEAKAIPELQKAASLDFYGDVHYQLYVAYRKLGKMQLADEALARSQELRRTSAARHQAMVSGVEKVE